MNLDIMSLMAASAAVAESTPKGARPAAEAADGADAEQQGPTFQKVLQGLMVDSSSELDASPPDLSLTQLASEAGSESLAQSDLPEPTPALPIAAPVTPTGESLPPDGNPLPLVTTTVQPGALVASDPSLPAAEPVKTVAGGPNLNSDPSAPAANVQRAATTGWFSQSAPEPTAPLERDVLRNTTHPAATSADVLARSEERPLPMTDQTVLGARALANRTASEEGRSPPANSLANLNTGLADSLSAIEASRASVLTNSTTAPTINGSLGPAAPTQAAASVAGATPMLNLAQSGWDQALGQRLVMMARNGLENAELRLDPPQLGSVSVKLALQGDQAQVIFHAANAAARDVLEGALPRLKEMFGAEGLQLGSAQVADREPEGRGRPSSGSDAWWSGESDEPGTNDSSEIATSVDQLTLPAGRIYEKV